MKFWTVKMPRLVIALLEMSHSLRFTKSVGHVHLPSGAAPGRPFGWLENVCHRGHIKPVSSCLGSRYQGPPGARLSDREPGCEHRSSALYSARRRGGCSPRGRWVTVGGGAGVRSPDSQLCPQEGQLFLRFPEIHRVRCSPASSPLPLPASS